MSLFGEISEVLGMMPVRLNRKRLLMSSAFAFAVSYVPFSLAQTELSEQFVPVPSATDLEIKPGECWVYGQINARQVEKTVPVTVKDSRITIDVTPAEIKRGYKQVVTREGTVTYRIQPATYKRVTEQVLVRPETTRFVKVPAVYEDRQKTVVVEEARTVVEQCKSLGGAVAFCAREIPAKEQTINVQVLIQPEQSKVEVVPAIYETVDKWVIDRPATVVEVSLAPKLDSVPVDEIVKPASANPVEVPAQIRQMQLKSYEGKPKMVMRRAVCNQDLNPRLVLDLQRSLMGVGYNPGPVDGMLGDMTINALQKFQRENGFAVGAVTFEALESLGVTHTN